ncbi:hypothetical protein BGZ97_003610 [Linnemannia gamsii]|jgi:hypothetical protein|uniref:Uncharacterized protein n=1 Tax=Linnemannia gamsii TaxID=64522 RepID=A0A9P6QT57_9FUNG|nr:hypothetical protein BGZ97_003610 [Linnemannia gamsii]
MTAALISLKRQPWDVVMREGFKRGPIPPPDDLINSINQTELSFVNLPRTGTTKFTFYISTTRLLKATDDAAEYLASLGQNVFVDTTGRSEPEGLYIRFLHRLDHYRCGARSYLSDLGGVLPVGLNGSLYKLNYEEIKSKEEKIPMLMIAITITWPSGAIKWLLLMQASWRRT